MKLRVSTLFDMDETEHTLQPRETIQDVVCRYLEERGSTMGVKKHEVYVDIVDENLLDPPPGWAVDRSDCEPCEEPNCKHNEPPHQRSDGFRCDRYPREQWQVFTALLRAAIRAQCTSAAFDADPREGIARANGWPRYVWGWFDGKVFEARHRTDPPGCYYKAYLLEREQHPQDPEGRLALLLENKS